MGLARMLGEVDLIELDPQLKPSLKVWKVISDYLLCVTTESCDPALVASFELVENTGDLIKQDPLSLVYQNVAASDYYKERSDEYDEMKQSIVEHGDAMHEIAQNAKLVRDNLVQLPPHWKEGSTKFLLNTINKLAAIKILGSPGRTFESGKEILREAIVLQWNLRDQAMTDTTALNDFSALFAEAFIVFTHDAKISDCKDEVGSFMATRGFDTKVNFFKLALTSYKATSKTDEGYGAALQKLIDAANDCTGLALGQNQEIALVFEEALYHGRRFAMVCLQLAIFLSALCTIQLLEKCEARNSSHVLCDSGLY